jgi:hypothetical protein
MPHILPRMTDTNHGPAPFNLSELDRQILAQTDEEFEYHDWDNLKDIIGNMPQFPSSAIPKHQKVEIFYMRRKGSPAYMHSSTYSPKRSRRIQAQTFRSQALYRLV